MLGVSKPKLTLDEYLNTLKTYKIEVSPEERSRCKTISDVWRFYRDTLRKAEKVLRKEVKHYALSYAPPALSDAELIAYQRKITFLQDLWDEGLGADASPAMVFSTKQDLAEKFEAHFKSITDRINRLASDLYT